MATSNRAESKLEPYLPLRWRGTGRGYWWDNISGNTCPEAGAFGELSYWKILADSMQEVSDLTGCSEVEHGKLDWVLAEGPSLPHSLEYAKSVLGTLASGESCHPVVHLGGQWLVSGAHDKALAAFLEQARNSQAQESELRSCRRRSGNRAWSAVVVVSRSSQWIAFLCRPAPGHVVVTF